MRERPLECSNCQKPLCVRFVQIDLRDAKECFACHECPVLARWYGEIKNSPSQEPQQLLAQETASICCALCDTKLESVVKGAPLGCPACYDLFADILSAEILKIPFSSLLHYGRAPEKREVCKSSLRLQTLNKALEESLAREAYEEAASLRDQIHALIRQELLDDPQRMQDDLHV